MPNPPANSAKPWHYALLLGATLVAFMPIWKAGFIFDDDSFLTANPLIRAPDGLFRFWFTGDAVDYWPVTSSTLWIEWRLWGMNPLGYHVTNLALHLGEVCLLWAILRRLQVPGAFLAALLFAVHPVNVETVVWITQRKNLMAMLFYLLSVLFFLKSLDKDSVPKGWGWYLGSLGAFALGMLSKGSVAMLPFVLLGCIAWSRRLSAKDLARVFPFLALSAVLVAVNIHFASHGPDDVIRTAGPIERFLGAGAVVWFYLGKALFPADLLFVYPQWKIEASDLLWWVPVAAAIAATVILWRWRKERPLLFAWGYFCLMLVPVMGFTDVYFMKYSLVSDHYQHLALIGIVAAVGWGWFKWRRKSRWTADATAVVAVVSLIVATFAQAKTYGDLEILYRATIAGNPRCWMARNNLGSLLRESGRVEEALSQDEEALKIKPEFAGVHYNLAVALTDVGKIPEAAEQYSEALKIRPDYVEAHINLAKLLHDAGRREDAFSHLQEALRLRPDDPEALNDLGNMYDEAGQYPQALAQYEKAVRIEPDSALAQGNYADTLARAGRLDEAVVHYRQGLSSNPTNARLHRRLAATLAQLGRMDEAQIELQKAGPPAQH